MKVLEKEELEGEGLEMDILEREGVNRPYLRNM
jgi:hypothetical protein